MLAAMFSGRHVVSRDNDGRFFIDCDGFLFKHILEYLRFGTIPANEQALNVYGYAEYFGINGLIKELEVFPAVRSVLRKRSYEAHLNHDFHLYEELKKKTIKEIEAFYGNENILISISIKLPLDVNCPQGVIPCQPFIYGNPKAGASKASAETKVSVSVTSKTYTGWSKCLAFDLRELGFATYTYYLDCEEILRCKRCSRFVGRIEYVLLGNNNILDIDKSGWRKP
ncbi:uncharacterized protein LOC123532444 isoform X2 [Mercenaria mercenaria]|nr:uncharacterized protein LOC123532444 isoform X2 [Mercenaria mercenaria]